MTPRRSRARAGTIARLGIVLLSLICALPVRAASQGTSIVPDAPIPVELPRDDGAHDTGIEWWYFTGHLVTADDARYGFEYVVFRARDGDLEGYVAHFAVTDNPRGSFRYDQRILGARGVAGVMDTLDLNLNGWTMRGGDGQFTLAASMPGYAIRLAVATTKPAALHDGDGYIDYGNGTASYYYSWTRLDVSGGLRLGEEWLPVRGEAWMDHQWGDFVTYQQGGWDWFAVQLDDRTDVMLSTIRGPGGETLRVDGSIVAPDGGLTTLGAGEFTVTPTGEWTSPHTGTTYPSGWTIAIPQEALTMTMTPAMPDQELDTRPTTGVIYWEGEALVAAHHEGRALAGYGYVELTGYAPFQPTDLGTPESSPQAGVGRP